MNRPDDSSAILSQIKRIDEACLRFEDEWLANRRPRIENYVAALPEADRREGLCEILLLEWTYRTQTGESFYRDEYGQRFTSSADAVAMAWERWKERERSLYTTDFPQTVAPDTATGPVAPALLGIRDLERLERIGAGGMGEVWKGFHPRLKRWVAVKLIRAEHATPEGIRRFRAEGETVGQLQHPHIVRVYDFTEHDAQPVLTMEYVAGGTLQGRLNEPLPAEEAARLVAVLAWTVHAAHEKGIVHRDLKPANVLMDAAVPGNPGTVLGGFPKITDFGLARMTGDGAGATLTGAVVGTPAFMSPEQAAGRTREIGPATDVWALGVILYRAVTGQLPFVGDSVLDTLERVKTLQFEPVAKVRPDLPAELVAACDACLRKDAGERPTAKRLAELLDRFVGGKTDSGMTVPRRRRPRWRLWGLAGGAALAAAVVLWLMFARGWKGEPERFTARLKVIHYDRVHKGRNEMKDDEMGTIGVDSMNTRFEDRVAIEASLSEPGHAYLIAFNFDGKEQLLWPCDARHKDRVALPDHPPDRVERFHYPPPAPEGVAGEEVKPKLFSLNDDKLGGIQAFVVVASREPLPPYAKWREARKAAPWRKLAPDRGVWRSNGETLDPMRKGGLRGRGSVVTREGQPPLLELCRWARAEGVAVEAIAFPVNPRD